MLLKNAVQLLVGYYSFITSTGIIGSAAIRTVVSPLDTNAMLTSVGTDLTTSVPESCDTSPGGNDAPAAAACIDPNRPHLHSLECPKPYELQGTFCMPNIGKRTFKITCRLTQNGRILWASPAIYDRGACPKGLVCRRHDPELMGLRRQNEHPALLPRIDCLPASDVVPSVREARRKRPRWSDKKPSHDLPRKSPRQTENPESSTRRIAHQWDLNLPAIDEGDEPASSSSAQSVTGSHNLWVI